MVHRYRSLSFADEVKNKRRGLKNREWRLLKRKDDTADTPPLPPPPEESVKGSFLKLQARARRAFLFKKTRGLRILSRKERKWKLFKSGSASRLRGRGYMPSSIASSCSDLVSVLPSSELSSIECSPLSSSSLIVSGSVSMLLLSSSSSSSSRNSSSLPRPILPYAPSAAASSSSPPRPSLVIPPPLTASRLMMASRSASSG
ncbi:hypothetical protein EYF80_047003 [Liparis tanakae]|uniref:Uncharacterized protein n=1 Tax=Liparis tanakae TaxID=230148 RepID=A0A4Z2FPT8_9TELE|nr:hypothetical protein EYF80_047003 [Liparis tanakae]